MAADTVIETAQRGLDPDTGLPALPPGYRWDVSFTETEYDFYPFLNVSLQKKRRIGWKTLGSVQWRLGYSSGSESVSDYESKLKSFELVSWRGYKYVLFDRSEYPTLILHAANKVLSKHQYALDRDQWFQDFKLSRTALSGTYPPKKLEQ